MEPNGLLCADVLLRNYSLTLSLTHGAICILQSNTCTLTPS